FDTVISAGGGSPCGEEHDADHQKHEQAAYDTNCRRAFRTNSLRHRWLGRRRLSTIDGRVRRNCFATIDGWLRPACVPTMEGWLRRERAPTDNGWLRRRCLSAVCGQLRCNRLRADGG